MAEKEGFEPSIPLWGIHDFQSCALDQLRDFSVSVENEKGFNYALKSKLLHYNADTEESQEGILIVHLPDNRLGAADKAADIPVVHLAFAGGNAQLTVDRWVQRKRTYLCVNILHNEF